MTPIAVSLIWAGALLYLAHQVLPVADRLISRALAIREQAQAKPEPPLNPSEIIVPDDIEAMIGTESEEWYREELRRQAKQRFAEFKDWNAARRALGIGSL